MRSVVPKNVFRVDQMTSQTKALNFDKTESGDEIAGERR
jgi:hypothetical protein